MGFFLNKYTALQLVRVSQSIAIDDDFVDTGYSIVGTTQEGEFEIALLKGSLIIQSSWPNFYVSMDVLPIDIKYAEHQLVYSRVGELVELTALLYAINSVSSENANIHDFLFRMLNEFKIKCFDSCNVDPLSIALIPELVELGFGVDCVISTERIMHVYLAKWDSHDMIEKNISLRIGVVKMEFKPTPTKKLNCGKWHEPRDYSVCSILLEVLKSYGINDPADCFIQSGKKELLTHFKWSKLAMMTNKEARSARIGFIQDNLYLASDIKSLAEALKNAELYSPNTSMSQIRKFLPGLLDEAQS